MGVAQCKEYWRRTGSFLGFKHVNLLEIVKSDTPIKNTNMLMASISLNMRNNNNNVNDCLRGFPFIRKNGIGAI